MFTPTQTVAASLNIDGSSDSKSDRNWKLIIGQDRKVCERVSGTSGLNKQACTQVLHKKGEFMEYWLLAQPLLIENNHFSETTEITDTKELKIPQESLAGQGSSRKP